MMPRPAVGAKFPDFELGPFNMTWARQRGPVIVLVWRTGCPVCRMAVPFFDRLQDMLPGATVVGVCQDDMKTTADYVQAEGLRMSCPADSTLAVSRLLGVDIVPSYWLVASNGDVLLAGESWDSAKLNEIAIRAAKEVGVPGGPVVRSDDDVPAFRPG